MKALKEIIKVLLGVLFLLFVLFFGELTANFINGAMSGISELANTDPGLIAILFIIFIFIVLTINPKLRKYKNFRKLLGMIYISCAIGFLIGIARNLVVNNINLISIIINLCMVGILGAEAWGFLDKSFDEEK